MSKILNWSFLLSFPKIFLSLGDNNLLNSIDNQAIITTKIKVRQRYTYCRIVEYLDYFSCFFFINWACQPNQTSWGLIADPLHSFLSCTHWLYKKKFPRFSLFRLELRPKRPTDKTIWPGYTCPFFTFATKFIFYQ